MEPTGPTALYRLALGAHGPIRLALGAHERGKTHTYLESPQRPRALRASREILLMKEKQKTWYFTHLKDPEVLSRIQGVILCLQK